jgi:glutathione S-transferase
MDLYFAPLACSLSARIALYEAGADARFIYADTKAKRLEDGSDFLAINPQGQVPVLRTDDGELFTENPVVLQLIAQANPQAGLAPTGGAAHWRLLQWLNFTTSELHKTVFIPLIDDKAPEGAKAYARAKAAPRLDYLNGHLDGRAFVIGDSFTIADAYLVTILNWARPGGIDLAAWPAVADYHRRMHERPAVARAFVEELALYRLEQARQAA